MTSTPTDTQTSDHLELGDVTVTRIEEMHGPIMPPDQFFPSLPHEAWQQHRDLLVPDHLDPAGAMVQVAMQTWLLRSEGKVILVDTGVGNDKARPAVPVWDHLQLDYLGALARAGVRPEDVDLVVNTHLHVDHVGWNTRMIDGQWVPTFPNATYLMPRADAEYWDPATNDRIAGGVNENVFEDSVAPVMAAGQVQLWEDTHVIDAHLRLESAPGHTPGMGVVKLDSRGERALFAADLLHSPVQVLAVDHDSCFCEDPTTARVTRRRLLGWAADTGAWVAPAHLSGRSAMTVERRDDAFTVSGWAPFPAYPPAS